MSVKWKIAVGAAALLVAGGICALIFAGVGKHPEDGAAVQTEDTRKELVLLKAVPSDAAALSIGSNVFNALQSDPGQKFIDLPLGAMKEEQAVVSYHYLGEMTPLVVMCAGKNGEVPEDLQALELAATALGISHAFIPSEKKSQKPNLFIFSPSENLLAASRRNLDENASILDIESFRSAIGMVPAKTESMVFKNEAIQHLLPNMILSRYVGRTVLCKFLSGTSEWTIMKRESQEPSGAGEYVTYAVEAMPKADKSKYLTIFDNLHSGESKVAPLLPHRTSFVIDLPIASIADWLDARTDWLDATSQLNQHKGQLRKAARSGQPGPVEWATAMDIKEVARVYWRGEQVLLIRPGKTAVSHNIKSNPTPGYLAPLFGAAFKIPDESRIACIGHWYIVGSAESVKHFLDSERKLVLNNWPEKSTKFVVLADDYKVYSGKHGIKIEAYKSY